MSTSGKIGPRMVGHNVTQGTYEYLTRLLDLGAVEGPLGAMKPNQSLAPVIEALHQVLAGGEVDMKVIRPGNQPVVDELNQKLEQASTESNEINASAGYTVATT